MALMSPLVVASHNAGKAREIEALLAPLHIVVKSAAELHLPEPEETGVTFEENAALKARAAALGAKMAALADDSGLVVPALDGDPGIYSARWAGPSKDFSVAMVKVAQALQEKGVEIEGTPAYFVSVLALADASGNVQCVRGEVHGTLTYPPRGAHGFGYDPMFVPNGYGETFGEMLAEKKQRISHRTRAFAALLELLETEHAA